MPRPMAGDSPASPISPYQTPPQGIPTIGGPAPLSYAGQPVPPTPGTKSVPTLPGLLNAFKRRWVLGTSIGLVVAIGIAACLWLALPGGKHEARGLIDLRDKNFELTSKNAEDYETYRKNQIFILKTRDLLNRTVNDPAVSSLEIIKTADDPVRVLEESISATAAAPSILAVTMKGNNIEEMKTIVDSLMKRYVDDATVTERRERADQTKKLEKLQEDLAQEIDGQEKHIKLLARGSGQTGGDGATNSQDLLLQRILDLDRMITNQNDDITRLESELENSEKRLGWFKLTDKSFADIRASGVPDSELEKLKILKDREYVARRFFVDELNKIFTKDELDRWRNNILAAAQQPNTQQQLVPEGEITRAINNDARVVKLALERDELRTRYERAKATATDPATSVVVLTQLEELQKKEKEIETKKQDIRSDIIASIRSQSLITLQNKVNELEYRIAVAKTTRDNYKQDREQRTKARLGAAVDHVEINQLTKGLDAQRDVLEKVRLQIVQNRMQAQLDNRVRVREAAQALPNNNLNKKLFMSGGLGVGTFLFVILLVAFLEWRTRRVDGVDQVVNDLGMRIIGTVPVFPNRASLKAAAEIGGANWRFALNEAINSTRTMLLHTARSQSMQVVMVTSATQGEGKTSITSQLATSMATAGMRTLIVDCDLRNPSIHKLFDLGVSPGVSEILTQDADPTDAIHPTTVPNLWVIPAGQCSNRVVAALAQGHPLETLFNRLRGQFDFVIVDSCPVLPVADALLVGQHVDGVLFSIMQDISQIPKVVLASDKLNQLNIPLLGAVVNGIKQDVYSYGYNYVKQLPV